MWTPPGAAGPFGGPIAHGYLTLSLLVPLFGQVLTVTDAGMGVNYGLNKARFPAPVPVGSKIRLRATLAAADPVPGGIQVSVDCIVEIEGGSSGPARRRRCTGSCADDGSRTRVRAAPEEITLMGQGIPRRW